MTTGMAATPLGGGGTNLNVQANVQGGNQFLAILQRINASLQQLVTIQNQAAASANNLARASAKVGTSLTQVNQSAVYAASGADRFLGAMRRATFTIGIFSGYVTGTMLRGMESLFSAFAKGGEYVVGTTANFERLRISLKTVFREAGEADRVFSSLKDLAKSTPFQLTDVVEGAAALKAVGIDIRESVAGGRNVLSLISDMAGALGRTIPDAIFSFKEAVAEGSWISLRRRFSITMSQIEGKLAEVAKRSGKTFEEAFDLSSASGRKEALSTFIAESFGGGSEALSQTFMGLKSNLQDSLEIFADMVGSSGPMALLKKEAKELYDLTSDMFSTGTAREWAHAIGQGLVELQAKVTDFAKNSLFSGMRSRDAAGNKVDIGVNLAKFVDNAADAIDKFLDVFQRGWETNQGTIFRISTAVVKVAATLWFNVFKATVSVLWEQWWGKLILGSFAALRVFNVGQMLVGSYKAVSGLSKMLDTAISNSATVFTTTFTSAAQVVGSGFKVALLGAIKYAGAAAAGIFAGVRIGTTIAESINSSRAKDAKSNETAANQLIELAYALRQVSASAEAGDKRAKDLVNSLGGVANVQERIRGLTEAGLAAGRVGASDGSGPIGFGELFGNDSVEQVARIKTDALKKYGSGLKDVTALLAAYNKEEQTRRDAQSTIRPDGGGKVQLFDAKDSALTEVGAIELTNQARNRALEKENAIRETIADTDKETERLTRRYRDLVSLQDSGVAISKEELTSAAAAVEQITRASSMERRRLEIRQHNAEEFKKEERLAVEVEDRTRAIAKAEYEISAAKDAGLAADSDTVKRLRELIDGHVQVLGPMKGALRIQQEHNESLFRAKGVVETYKGAYREFGKEIEAAESKVGKLIDKMETLANKVAKIETKMIGALRPFQELQLYVDEKIGGLSETGARDRKQKIIDEELARARSQDAQNAAAESDVYQRMYGLTKMRDAALANGSSTTEINKITAELLAAQKELESYDERRIANNEMIRKLLEEQVRFGADRQASLEKELEAETSKRKEMDQEIEVARAQRDYDLAIKQANKKLGLDQNTPVEKRTHEERMALERALASQGESKFSELLKQRREAEENESRLKDELDRVKRQNAERVPGALDEIQKRDEQSLKDQSQERDKFKADLFKKIDDLKDAFLSLQGRRSDAASGEMGLAFGLSLKDFQKGFMDGLGYKGGDMMRSAASKLLELGGPVNAESFSDPAFVKNFILKQAQESALTNSSLLALVGSLETLSKDLRASEGQRKDAQKVIKLLINVTTPDGKTATETITEDGSGEHSLSVDAGGG